MTNIQIRPVTPQDHAAWLPLWQAYLTFYKTVLPDAVIASTWQRFLDPAEPTNAALAWQDGKAVGLVHFIYHRSTWTLGNYCYLQDLYVAEGIRGGGIGRQLIEHVYTEAAAAGASRVYWLTHETNTDAMHLYDKVADRSGFVQYRKLFA